ncbi:MAG: hypothetical protein L7G90_03355 [Candidatus Nanopusillus sp.]|nr:hypothetical protein [Candidatus Nanopusillus sp.]
MGNCGLTLKELGWFRSLQQQLAETYRLIDEWIDEDTFNMFATLINALLEVNCKIVAKREYRYGWHNYLDLALRCGADTYVVAKIRDSSYDDYYERLKKELSRLGYEGEITEVSIDQLETNNFKIELYWALSGPGKLYTYVGRPIELLRWPWLKAYVLHIGAIGSHVYFKVPIKGLFTRGHVVKYWFGDDGNCGICREGDCGLLHIRYPPWLLAMYQSILRVIYKKRNEIKERVDKAIYFAVKIPTILSMF